MITNSIITVDLASQTIQYDSKSIQFDIDESRKKTLLEGLDDIAVTLQRQDKISQYEKSHF
jgi:3-isopropylmalate/(R)-2-methylmalate dehydratase small subunit